MSNCSGIFQGGIIDCDVPLAVGVRQRVLLANKEDIAAVTFSVVPGEENVVDTITMKSLTAFYEFEGVNESISAQTDLVRQAVSNGYDHTVNLSVFEVDNVSRLNLQGMAYKKQVAIVQGSGNDNSYGNAKYTIYGLDSGLDLQTNVRILADAATGGAYSLVLKTSDTGGKEGALPYPFFLTSYTVTDAAVEALLIPAI